LHPEGKQEPSALDPMRSLADDAARRIEKEAKSVLDKED
jgi:hypothetical protein